MSIITGRDAFVNGIPCTQSWSVNRDAAVTRYAASCVGRGTGVTRGVKNVTGQMTGVGANPLITPGVDFTFKGVIDNSFGAAKVLDGTIRINSLNIAFPKESGGLITWTAGFGAQGDLTEGTTGAADATYVLHEGATQITNAILDTDDYSIPGFRQASLTITAPEKPYVINGVIHRLSGNLEADISIDVYDDDYINARFEPNVVDGLYLYADSTTFWFIQWVRFTGISNMLMNRGTQDIIGYTINGMWTATNAGALGSIIRPSTVALFP